MPSADFCAAIGSPHGSPSPKSRTRHRPPRLSLPTFVARPPDLQPEPSMDGGLRRFLSARPTRTAYYPIPVRRAATLLHAAFRRHVAGTPLRFANPSPPSRWIRDLHPQVDKHAWQTRKRPGGRGPAGAFVGIEGGFRSMVGNPAACLTRFRRRRRCDSSSCCCSSRESARRAAKPASPESWPGGRNAPTAGACEPHGARSGAPVPG